jgi:photosystem II stability/assembly factor-like uncharacterized protein
MSGRVVDVAVVEKRPSTMFVASASGGLWKTVNNGTTWEPVFDKQTTLSLGAVAVAQSNPAIVWVGTGEANPRNSVSSGDGVYKSTNGGRTWTCQGLRDSQHIGRIVIHPTDPDIVYVAALGHLWGPNKERGLYKTTNGGRTWERVKFIDEDTGFIDVAMDPADPDILYAAAWQVRRDAFAGGIPAVQTGPGSGLFRTTDGGRTWEPMTAGLPRRPLGRCGLAVCRKDPRVVCAVVQTDRTDPLNQGPNLKGIGEGPKLVKEKLSPDEGGIFRSEDRGRTWKQVNSLVPRPFYYGQIRIDPNDPARIYVLGIQMFQSHNGGRIFYPGNAAAGTHPDYHALWIDPRDSDHLVLGCDGGLYFSYDRCKNWEHLKNLPLAQFYGVAVDMRRPFRVYGGLQDNGSWGGPSASADPAGITFADWVKVFGADGFYCQADPNDPETVYGETQYGKLQRLDLRTGEAKFIQPRLKSAEQASNLNPTPATGAAAFRFNWSAPVLLSSHDSRTVYFGGNHLFRSTNRGETWQIVSPDLTHGRPGPSKNTGHTITTLAESTVRAGLLYVGTDDGRVHISRDGGRLWTDLSAKIPGLPPERWVSRVVCSAFKDGTAYLTIDRHRNDDRRPYVFKTSDFGETWLPLVANLPADCPVHVIREDPRRCDLLYLGTEGGLFLSLDGGVSWHRHKTGLPPVAVHDLLVHPRDQELVIATHGRGIFIVDVAPLQELTPKALVAEAYLCSPRAGAVGPLRRNLNWAGTRMFLGTNPPTGIVLYYHLKAQVQGHVSLTISDTEGKKLAAIKLSKADMLPGMHRRVWNPSPEAKTKASLRPQLAPGDYLVTLQVGELTLKKRLRVGSPDGSGGTP